MPVAKLFDTSVPCFAFAAVLGLAATIGAAQSAIPPASQPATEAHQDRLIAAHQPVTADRSRHQLLGSGTIGNAPSPAASSATPASGARTNGLPRQAPCRRQSDSGTSCR